MMAVLLHGVTIVFRSADTASLWPESFLGIVIVDIAGPVCRLALQSLHGYDA